MQKRKGWWMGCGGRGGKSVDVCARVVGMRGCVEKKKM